MDTDVLVIGAGQCGLALSRELRDRGVAHEVLTGDDAPGDVWRRRWDSLRLFTPARFDALPGMPFPAPPRHRPTAAEFAGYLDDYAERAAVPLHTGTRVARVTADPSGGFVVGTAERSWRSRRVVIATGGDSRPRVPAAAAELDPGIRQRHTSEYRRPDDLPGRRVLVVGCGTSGVQLGVELARAGRDVTVAGRPRPRIPRRLLAVAGTAWFAFLHRVLTRATPIGRKAALRAPYAGAPLIGITARDLDEAGAARGPRMTGVSGGLPVLEDGRVVECDAVLWATGYRSDLGWVEGLAVDDRGLPAHIRGLSTDVDGLAFLGLPFQFGLTSTLIGGAGRDAAFVADALARTAAPTVKAG
ncbi:MULTISPECIES: flavin-containing monooxygenase [Microbacterium]|uniref:flavin-containing monooxygenase n=1 Tax=Microbacterium TaxID=33882 RepID=UPI00217E4887|nr:MULTISPECIES: NAD(P)/FAD-dependent oxidoreductase [Microbacterium]UWF77655.1 NAD(P)-binding domain-containing protein [Microbacterium neungamense]WCM55824.1 NAD(P)-binding domain-containing protein [Microbacterium sp. EF45047]